MAAIRTLGIKHFKVCIGFNKSGRFWKPEMKGYCYLATNKTKVAEHVQKRKPRNAFKMPDAIDAEIIGNALYSLNKEAKRKPELYTLKDSTIRKCLELGFVSGQELHATRREKREYIIASDYREYEEGFGWEMDEVAYQEAIDKAETDERGRPYLVTGHAWQMFDCYTIGKHTFHTPHSMTYDIMPEGAIDLGKNWQAPQERRLYSMSPKRALAIINHFLGLDLPKVA
jgi:hypothetical protein